MDKSLNLKTEQKVTARKVITTSFLVDISDIILSLSVALLSGSVIMLTQVLEGFSDVVASGFLLVGLKRSMHAEDKTHPFGYGREIYFWSFLSAIVMFGLTSTLSFYFGWQRFIHPQPVHDIGIALGILILTFFTNAYAFFLSCRRMLRKRPLAHILKIFYSSSLVETKTTFILDLMGVMASLFGTIALGVYVLTGNIKFDGLGAMVIGVTLAISSLFLVSGIRELLIGKRASEETEKKIREAALSVREVEEVLDLKTLHVGSEKLLVDLDVHMEAKLGTRELEKLMDKIEEKIKEKVPSAKYVLVELQTPRKNY